MHQPLRESGTQALQQQARQRSIVDQGEVVVSDRAIDGPPLGAGPHAVSGGAVRYFQFYFRDAHGPGGSGYNLSDGLKVTFCE